MSIRGTPMIIGLMTSCGLYNSTGTYIVNVGIPTKSGVGGGLLAACILALIAASLRFARGRF